MKEIDFESNAFNPYAERAGVRCITDQESLNQVMKECDIALQKSDNDLRSVFRTFKFSFDYSQIPSDPFSLEYKNYQLSCYKKLAGREYRIENELSNFLDVKEAISHPFPFYTGSYRTVSDQLIMVGLIIRTLKLPSGSKILEFGSGWGNTAVNLARMGYRVTVVDVEQRFLDVIKGRAKDFEDMIETVRGDFSIIDELPDSYDAILFKECFHHCLDHPRFVAALRSKLADGGVVCFAGEPVYPEFPIPWGVQFDGESVWAMRNFGWLELGFSESYFRDLLEKNGFMTEKQTCQFLERGTIFVARTS